MTAVAGATALALLLAAPLLAAASYLAWLALWASPARRRPLLTAPPALRFCVLVPAHDEEAGIGRTVRNLLALDYPPELRRVWVIADNCSDGTAAAASAAGAEVLVRTDPARRGKGQALTSGFGRVLADGWAEALAVVDADTLASGNLLRAFAERFASGADALQADYRVLEDRRSWRTRLLKLAFALFHGVRSLARERLGLSCGLRGNGMAFRAELLRRVPHRAESVVEDLEYGLDLGEAGVRVAYVAEAEVVGEMPSNEAGARSQRARWEGGRAALRRRVPRLLRDAWKRRSLVLCDLALDLALPPLSTLCLATVLGGTLVVVGSALGWVAPLALVPWVAAGIGLLIYVLRGWWLAEVGWRGLLDLAWAPVFVIWKVVRVRARPESWVRTARNRPR